MRCPAELRSRLCARVAVLAIVAAGAAGCSSDISRFNDSPFSNSMASRSGAPPSEVTGSVPSGRVETAPLPAPSRPNVSSTGVATGGGGMASYQPPLPPPPPATRLAGASAPVHQPVFGGGGATTRPAPAVSNAVHVVKPGETLTSIARSYGKTRPEIAKANKLDGYAQVRVGQRLTIPGVRQTRNAAPAQPTTRPAGQPTVATQQLAPPAAAPAQPRMAAAQGTATARLATPATQSPEPAPAAAPVSTAETTGAVPSFRWPVRGRVIAGFGTKVNGASNDGINVAVPEGTSVKASEDGVVAYSGNELKGYGNLVLVRHSNGFVTAYAHASEVMVKRGDQVKRGQIIAKAGQSGNASSPQLHFEIRKGSTPVDPTQYLASN
jgi:murein DD-endopeptidase MepM/ murein hydrolase activator NlpD